MVQLLGVGELVMSLHADGTVRVWDAKTAGAAVRSAAVQAAASRAGGGAYPPPALSASLLLSSATIPASAGAPTVLLHPHTYVNKVAVGTSSGSVVLLNVRSGKTVHVCEVAPGTAVTALAQSPALDVVGVGCADGRLVVHNLRADEPVCAFAHAAADARSAGGAVTSIAFSFGNTLTMPVVATATSGGALALWDLQRRALLHALPGAHGGRIPFVAFVPRQPVLLTAGWDNALHMWQLDTLTGAPTVLRSRSGHTGPPRLLRYYHGASGSGSGGGGSAVASMAGGADASVCELATAGGGDDRSLRITHTALARQCAELSQGHLTSRAKALGCHPNALKLPPITAIALSDRRHGQWADVVTAHAGSSRAYLWSWERKKLEERALQLDNPAKPGETVSSVSMSACGHYALVGGSGGSVVKFNLQSAARRGTFPRDPGNEGLLAAKGPKVGPTYAGDIGGPADRDTGKGGRHGAFRGAKLHVIDSIDTALLRGLGIAPAPHLMPKKPEDTGKKGAKAAAAAAAAAATSGPGGVPSQHACAVTGVGVDALNSTVVSADGDGWVLFWDFGTHAHKGGMRLASPAASLALHREAGLAAVACDDFGVRVIDVATRRLVRSFGGHTNRVCDVAFSPDARWLATASLDRSIRIWDLPTGRCVDWLAFSSPPSSLSFSPSGEYLVTSHADSPAIFLWASKQHFGTALAASDGSAAAAAAGGAGEEGVGGGPVAPVQMDLPGSRVEGDVVVEEGATPAAGAAGDAGAAANSDIASNAQTGSLVPPRPDTGVSLSGLAPSAWVNLTSLEVIAARNKPTLPPTKPASAPFFLPTAGGLAPAFVAPPSGTGTAADAPDAAAAAGAAGGEWSGAWKDEDEAGDGEARSDSGSALPDGNDAGADAAMAGLSGNGRHLTTATAAAIGIRGRIARTRLSSLLLRAFPDALQPLGVHDAAADDSDRDSDSDAQAAASGSDSEASLVALSTFLAQQTPSALDAQVRSLCLGPQDGPGLCVLTSLLRYLSWALSGSGGLKAVGRYELAHAHLGLLLETHGDTLAEVTTTTTATTAAAGGDGEEGAGGDDDGVPSSVRAGVRSALAAVRQAQRPEAAALRAKLDKGLAMLAFFLGQ